MILIEKTWEHKAVKGIGSLGSYGIIAGVIWIVVGGENDSSITEDHVPFTVTPSKIREDVWFSDTWLWINIIDKSFVIDHDEVQIYISGHKVSQGEILSHYRYEWERVRQEYPRLPVPIIIKRLVFDDFYHREKPHPEKGHHTVKIVNPHDGTILELRDGLEVEGVFLLGMASHNRNLLEPFARGYDSRV